jgi:hypothetical protein
MTVPPPPQRKYIVQGRDGRQHAFELDELRRRYAAGEITAAHQVFSHATGEWHLAAELPELRDVSVGESPVPADQKSISACGGCALIVAVVIVIGMMVGGGSDHSSSSPPGSASDVPPSSPAAVPLSSPSGVGPAVRRVSAAEQLQSIFDSSIIKGLELKFVVRGRRCDVLHVEGYSTLEPSMMDAIAYGTLIYGQVLPGGVNQFAFDAGFRDVVYTNVEDARFRSFGASNLKRKQVRSARRCTEAIASDLSATETPVERPAAPRFEPLSWSNADEGRRIYNGAYEHEATIVSVDRPNDLIRVRYVRSGTTEPKKLSAVARYWYVKLK